MSSELKIHRIVAVIPARSGSKRLMGKNKRLFCGKPLIAWTVELALSINMIDKVIVSSDDSDILEGCLWFYGNNKRLEIIKRPKELAQDDTELWEVLNHLFMKDHIREKTIICLLQPTSPLRNVLDVQKALMMFLQKPGGVIPITKIDSMNYRRCGTVFVDWNHQIYNHSGFRENQFILIPPERAIDIDTLEDFEEAEIIMKEILEKS